MVNAHPRTRISLEEIITRSITARQIIAGFAAEMPALAEFWRNLDTALADNLTLTAELTAARLDRANLLAAARATLAAHAGGEADPLYYLQDELEYRQMRADRHGRPA